MNRFDIVDATDEDCGYRHLGSFSSLEEAVKQIEDGTIDGPEGFTDIYDDVLTIQVIEHPVGFGPLKFVWERSWDNVYENGMDENKWIIRSKETAAN